MMGDGRYAAIYEREKIISWKKKIGFFEIIDTRIFFGINQVFSGMKKKNISGIKTNREKGDYCCLCLSQGWLATRSALIYGQGNQQIQRDKKSFECYMEIS